MKELLYINLARNIEQKIGDEVFKQGISFLLFGRFATNMDVPERVSHMEVL